MKRRPKILSLVLVALGLALAGVGASWASPQQNNLPANLGDLPLERYEPVVVAKLPHPKPNYTQGLVVYGGFLYESTGLRGRSSLKQIDAKSGEVVRFRRMNPKYFAEGLAVHEGVFVQLTWTSGRALWYRAKPLSTFKTTRYKGEGWGLSTWTEEDKSQWLMSDGSALLTFRNIESFEVERSVEALWPDDPNEPEGSGRDKKLNNLNELEVVFPIIYANVWRESWIAMVDGRSGLVVGVIDCIDLVPKTKAKTKRNANHVLNGIAYEPTSKHFFLTGKGWPWIYKVSFERVPTPGRR